MAHITFTMIKKPAVCVSTTGWPSDAPILDKGSDRSKDQPEPQNACFFPKTKMLAKTFEIFRLHGMCTVEEEMMAPFSALTEPSISILATRRLPRACMHRFKPKFEDCRFRQFFFSACSRSSQLVCLCHVNGRYSLSLLHADPTRSRCKPRSRSFRLGFTILGRGLPCLRMFARVYLRGVSPG